MINYLKTIILKYPRAIPFIKKWFRILRIRKKDKLINSIMKERSTIKSWINNTIDIHRRYNIKDRKYIIKKL